jgi:hypothetical protein
MTTKTPEAIKATVAEWSAQPSSAAIMAEARARCKNILSLKAVCTKNNVDFWAAQKYVYHQIRK